MKKMFIVVSLAIFFTAVSVMAQTPKYGNGREAGGMLPTVVRNNASDTATGSNAREIMKNRFAQIKDARKREVVARINDQLNELNKRLTEHFIAVLDKLESLLKRIASRADKDAARGLDVTTVRQAIADAENAISAARTAVDAQAAKTYDIALTTETKLRSDVKKFRDLLRDDLSSVRDIIQSTYKAVQKAAVTLAQIHGEDENRATSTSASSTEH